MVSAILTNNSTRSVGYAYTTGYMDSLDSGTTAKVRWNPYCIELEYDDTTVEYPSKFPEGRFIRPGLFSSEFDATINGDMTITLPDGSVLVPGKCLDG